MSSAGIIVGVRTGAPLHLSSEQGNAKRAFAKQHLLRQGLRSARPKSRSEPPKDQAPIVACCIDAPFKSIYMHIALYHELCIAGDAV